MIPSPTTSRRSALRLRTAACVAVTALAVAACGSSGNGSSTATTASTASPTSSGTPATTSGGGTSGPSGAITAASADLAKFTGVVSSYATIKPLSGVSRLKGKTVWYIPIGASVPILSAFGLGMRHAATKLGMNFHECDGKFLPTTISSCINQAATQGANGVVTGYIDYRLVPTAFQNLVAHHIPVLVAGEANDTGKAATPQFAFDDTSPSINVLQKLNDEEVIVDSKGKAKILFIGVTDSPQTLGAAAYSRAFFKTNCPGCTLAYIEYNTAELQRVPSQVSAALLANPGTTYVISELDASAADAASGIQTAGFTNKVKLAGTNGGLDSLQRIKEGQIQFADAGTSAVFLGWQFADGIARMMLGGFPVNGLGISRIFTKANVGNLTLTPAAYETNDWYGGNSFEQPYLTAWGLK